MQLIFYGGKKAQEKYEVPCGTFRNFVGEGWKWDTPDQSLAGNAPKALTKVLRDMGQNVVQLSKDKNVQRVCSNISRSRSTSRWTTRTIPRRSTTRCLC